MNLIEKVVSYFCLRAEGFDHEAAAKEFKRNPITFEDKVVIGWVIFMVIVVAVLIYDAHNNKQIEATLEQKRIAEHKRKVAENKAIKHEQIVLTMLNGGYLRVDGVTRKACIKDTNGECL